jgi:hypothetical protein
MSNLNSNAATTSYDLMIRTNTGPEHGNTAICKLCREFAQISIGNEKYTEIYDYNSGDIICAKCAESVDKSIADLVTGKTELPEGDYFGDCPKCGKNNGYLNVHKTHWFICETHKTCWCIGSNLFSSWKDENEETWKKNDKMLSECRVVKDWHRWAPHAPEGELEWVTATKATASVTSSDCVLCDDGDMDKGGGIFWTDNKWVCTPCWGGLVDSWGNQQVEEVNSKPCDLPALQF